MPNSLTFVPLYGWEQSHVVNSVGVIRSLNRFYTRPRLGTRLVKGRELKQRPDKDGYMTVCLNYEGKQLTKWVHVAVAESFLGPRPKSDSRVECCHLNGDRTDNCVENLAWATSKENSAHMVGHGTRAFADSHPRAKLTKDQVIEILNSDLTVTELSRKFDVARSTITSITHGPNWQSVKDELRADLCRS